MTLTEYLRTQVKDAILEKVGYEKFADIKLAKLTGYEWANTIEADGTDGDALIEEYPYYSIPQPDRWYWYTALKEFNIYYSDKNRRMWLIFYNNGGETN